MKRLIDALDCILDWLCIYIADLAGFVALIIVGYCCFIFAPSLIESDSLEPAHMATGEVKVGLRRTNGVGSAIALQPRRCHEYSVSNFVEFSAPITVDGEAVPNEQAKKEAGDVPANHPKIWHAAILFVTGVLGGYLASR